MKLYEFMGKDFFEQFQIPVPPREVVTTPGQAAEAVKKIGPAVIKSQVLTGKRGKAGGIAFVDTPEEAEKEASRLLGMVIRDFKVEKLLVESKLQIDRELYLAVTVDGAARRPLVLASTEGGMDIEEVPDELIVKKNIDVSIGLYPYITREITRRLGLRGAVAKEFALVLQNLYRMFREIDAELVEINPLVVSGEKVIAADAKVTLDDEALYRHEGFPRVEEKTELEKKADELGVAYVELDGDIAVMANGAGMAMATLDMLQYYGGSAANFLDAGGGAGVEQTAQALKLLLGTNPKVVLINIFGGITRCDDVANAFATVKKSVEIKMPVVFRLVGTNEEEGIRILKEVGISAYRTMQEATQKAVELAKAN